MVVVGVGEDPPPIYTATPYFNRVGPLGPKAQQKRKGVGAYAPTPKRKAE
jgi:hypothetical protein